jgi:hypothetical protein
MVLALMADPTLIPGVPYPMSQLLIAAGLSLFGFLWIRHIIEPGPFLRGESVWRFRDRGRVDRVRRAVRSLIAWPRSRTSGWWATRLEFGLAGVILALATIGLQSALSFVGVYGPATLAVLATTGAGYAGILLGIRWMRRIYLAPLEADPEVGWRYRAR